MENLVGLNGKNQVFGCTYLFWENFIDDDIGYRHHSHATEEDDEYKTDQRHPIIAWIIV